MFMESKTNHYTHELRIERSSPNNLKAELSNIKLDAIDVRIITQKIPRFPDDAVYIISFKRGTTSLHGILKECRHIFHKVVRWEHLNAAIVL